MVCWNHSESGVGGVGFHPSLRDACDDACDSQF